jgi:uncharacterized protein YqgC (DUF456 family)
MMADHGDRQARRADPAGGRLDPSAGGARLLNADLVLVHVVVGLLLAAGLVGSVLPFLPGPPLIFAGALVYALATSWMPIGIGRLAILGALAVLAYALGHVASALGARRFGGSWWAVAGALGGAVIGVFFGPLGLLFGPVIGAVAAEFAKSGDLEVSTRSGIGALVGMAIGVAANLGLAIVMVALFLWWAWRG